MASCLGKKSKLISVHDPGDHGQGRANKTRWRVPNTQPWVKVGNHKSDSNAQLNTQRQAVQRKFRELARSGMYWRLLDGRGESKQVSRWCRLTRKKVKTCQNLIKTGNSHDAQKTRTAVTQSQENVTEYNPKYAQTPAVSMLPRGLRLSHKRHCLSMSTTKGRS